jgi:Family of unknown function (DUF5343)
MGLPDSYTHKPSAIPEYFEAILKAQAPDRFSQKFLEQLGYKSTNDRLFIGILKDLGFLDTDGVPTERYYRFHDRSQSKKVIAEGIREAYSGLFAVNQTANELSVEEVNNKLRTLYAGSKTDPVISRIARTFTALCEFADFEGSGVVQPTTKTESKGSNNAANKESSTSQDEATSSSSPLDQRRANSSSQVSLDSLQYHINIVLPESRDQAVYDAIFKSLRDHLGR